jgi:hypothetical protein
MNEMQLVEEFRAAVAPPDPQTLTRARARVLAGTADGQASRRARWPRLPGSWPKLALTGLAATTMAAAVAVTLAVPGGAPAHPGAATPSAKELAYRVAGVAAARPNVRPGQWVYIKAKNVEMFGGTFHWWTTADGTRSAGTDLTGPHKGKLFFMPCPRWAKGRHGSCQAWMDGPAGLALIPVTYAGLKSLPRSPAALDRYLARLPLPGVRHGYLARLPLRDWGPAPYREFNIISALLFTYVMPPALTAELYRALGDIPGVTVDRHVVDVAGRAGIGFQITAPRSQDDAGVGVVDQLILNPKTYDLMGQQSFDTGQRRPSVPRHVYGRAILKTALVSGPGVRP